MSDPFDMDNLLAIVRQAEEMMNEFRGIHLCRSQKDLAHHRPRATVDSNSNRMPWILPALAGESLNLGAQQLHIRVILDNELDDVGQGLVAVSPVIADAGHA
jgi:hypothetical protein